MTELFSLITTPLLIFISTAHDSYLKNQVNFGYNPRVLLPYYMVALLMLIIGVFIYSLKRRVICARLLWIYYFLGPFLVAFVNLKNRLTQLDKPLGAGFFLLVITIGAYGFTKYVRLSKFTRFMSHLSILFILVELVNFTSRYKINSHTRYLDSVRGRSHEVALTSPVDRFNASNTDQSTSHLPNIYHIVLDEYQTDMFEETLTPALSDALSGFRYFPKNITVYGRTRMSLASVFLGKSYGYDEGQLDYLKSSYNSADSILHDLKARGYSTVAYIHKVHPFPQPLLDVIVEHKDNINRDIRIDYSASFRSLWIFTNTPAVVARRLIPQEHFTKLVNRNLLTNDGPIRSYASFQNYLRDEAQLPAHGRYTFLHLILPHFPNVFTADCQYTFPVVKETTPREQTVCTNRVLVQFVDTLKELDRFDDSLIVVHADHGSRYEIRDGEYVNIETADNYALPYSQTRSRALLLIKPPGVSADAALVRSSFRSQNTDIAPTIMGFLDEADRDFEGLDLFDRGNETAINSRTRYYHYLDKADDNETTETFTRYIVHDDRVERERVIPAYKLLVE